jgi:hypothetical protein
LFIAGSIVGRACWVEIHLPDAYYVVGNHLPDACYVVGNHLPDACYVVGNHLLGKNLVNFLETYVETRGKHVECHSEFPVVT